MKDFFFFLLCGIFSLVLQTTVFYLIPGTFHVDLILIIVVYLGFTRDVAWGGVLAFCLGYMMDIGSGGIPGTFSFSKFIVLLITATVAKRFFTKHPMFIFFLVFLFSLMDGLIMLGILRIQGTWRVEGLDVGNVLLQAAATGLIAPFVFALLRRVDATMAKFLSKKTTEGRGWY
ncbi:MAG: rod shape-determining protein MreD [Deltaproteobacteria bacterium]|nr:rod shape-determining protein MreD [Deltaproteobacteria bacterium]MBW2307236.1 rod shape-determining protein MreD [Deltaproteobacteria bacterium]